MVVALAIVCVIAAVALGCWVSAERSLADCERELRETRDDLATALNWDGPTDPRQPVVLHAIDGGRS